MMLKVRNIRTKIGRIEILDDISMEVNEGELVSVIGANGAGKSTLLNTISGVYTPYTGEVTLFEENITKLPPYKTIRKGIALVPEGRQVFPGHTVIENLKLGSYTKYYRNMKHVHENIDKMLDFFPNLQKHQHNLGGNLSGGEQQMLAIARALMSDPKVILLDEPSMGLAPKIVNEILNNLQQIKKEFGTMIVLVEQNINAALKVSDRVYVLEEGQFVLEGTSEEVANNPNVKSAYLGIETA